MVAIGTIAALSLLVGLLGVGIGLANDSRDGTGSGVAVTADPVEFELELGEMYVEPSSIEVPVGAPVVLTVTNAGAAPHDLVVPGGDGTRMLDPGETETVTVGPFDQSTVAWCTVPGHREAGMEMDIVVTGAATPVAAHGDHGAAGAGPGAAIDFNAEPDAEWVPFDPALAPAPGGTEHEVTFRMTETVIEIAPGVTQEAWTFEDQVPGPTLRGNVGDLFTVTIVNEGDLAHSIDFHASKVAWNVEMRDVLPGDSLVYQFEAKHAGVFMYHCGTAPALHHIGNGMFGAVVIDPPDLPEVDHEYAFVQSEWYTGPEGEPGSLTKMQQDAWDAVVFNGYVNQYLHAPIDDVEVGERVRAFVLNAGPSENSSFHIVGTIFDTTYKEGAYTLRPGAARGGAQALDLQPAQGGFVEFTFDADGLYPIVTHKFSNVGKGALGLFSVGEVEMPDGAAH